MNTHMSLAYEHVCTLRLIAYRHALYVVRDYAMRIMLVASSVALLGRRAANEMPEVRSLVPQHLLAPD